MYIWVTIEDLMCSDSTAYTLVSFCDTYQCFQALVEQARGMLETIDGVTTVHGRFYELCSNYHKVSVVSFNSHTQ